jgi:hypothetical protein
VKIQDDLPTDVLSRAASACGFRVAYSREPDLDEWSLSSGHGERHVEYVGTRRTICAFLVGFVASRDRAIELLKDLRDQQREAFLRAMRRIEAGWDAVGGKW